MLDGERRKERPEKWKDLEPSFTLPTYDEKADSDTYRIPSGSKSKLSTNTVITLKEREHTVTGPEGKKSSARLYMCVFGCLRLIFVSKL